MLEDKERYKSREMKVRAVERSMPAKSTHQLARLIHAKAKEFGADLAGTANVGDLKRSPSHEISQKMPEYKGVGTKDAGGRKRGVVEWPEETASAIVIAVAHPPEKPDLDWWVTKGNSTGNTPGNRLLINMASRLAEWLENEQGVRCFKTPYHIEHGGIYMKDAAVFAGLGRIGKNNMLINSRFGPRLRLRVLLTDADLPSEGIVDFNPCEACPEPCRAACPQDAFAERIYSVEAYGMEALPGRDGDYSRLRCNRQMMVDEMESEELISDDNRKGSTKRIVRYCRKCEMACPIGSEQTA